LAHWWVELREFVREMDQIRATWSTYAKSHTGPDGCPLDPAAYAATVEARNHSAWSSFLKVERHIGRLLKSAKGKVDSLPHSTVPSHWRPQLAVLDSALDRIDDAHEEWILDAFGTEGPITTENRLHATTARCARSWEPLTQWADHGLVLLDICVPMRPGTSPPGLTVSPPSPPSAPRHTR
jgi:hypothetical protein